MSIPILATKLCTPLLRPDLTPRPRLVHKLNEGLWQAGGFFRRLTLFCAPAGYGKTTLAVEWLRGCGRPFAWLTRDESDDDPARFLACLAAALGQLDAGIGESAAKLLQAPPQPPSEALPAVFLTALVNEIARIPSGGILVLDDYHLVRAPAVHQVVNFLLEHLPATLHLAILSREDPAVPIIKLRAGGQLAEIRQADLAFTLEETGEFLRHAMGVDLELGDIRALASRTEGWAVGLQLAAISMQGSDDLHGFVQSFTGSTRYILDYLFEEVFSKQPPGIQDFLLKTCVVNRLSASLCDALTEGHDSRSILDQLERTNLFVTRLHPLKDWYRYHPLFVDLLRHRLRLAPEPAQAVLHLKASGWFEQNGLGEEAVEHALSAGDWERAARLVDQATGDMLKRGALTTLTGWLKRLPEDVIYSSPGLCLDYAWPLLLASQVEPAGALLRRAQTLASDDPSLLGNIALAQAYLAQVVGDQQGLIEHSEHALALLPAADLASRAVVATNLGVAYWHSGRLDDTERSMAAALQHGRQSGNDYAALTASIFLARCQAVRGRLRLAEEYLRRLLEASPDVPILTLACLDLGAIAYEWDDLPRSGEYIRTGLEIGQRSGNAEFQIAALVLLAHLKLAQGDYQAARQAHQEACQVDASSHAPLRAESRLAALRVELALAGGEDPACLETDLPEDVDFHPFYRFLGLAKARLWIALGRTEQAARHLQDCAAAAERAGWGYGLIAARLLQALSADEPDEALSFLSDALLRAEPEGYLRTFADAGERLSPLLLQAARRGIAPEYAGKILAAIGKRTGSFRPGVPGMLEPLSEREIEVLRLVAAGLSNRQIAARMIVSLSTVKSHVHHICAKLEAASRLQAVSRARELGLI